MHSAPFRFIAVVVVNDIPFFDSNQIWGALFIFGTKSNEWKKKRATTWNGWIILLLKKRESIRKISKFVMIEIANGTIIVVHSAHVDLHLRILIDLKWAIKKEKNEPKIMKSTIFDIWVKETDKKAIETGFWSHKKIQFQRN